MNSANSIGYTFVRFPAEEEFQTITELDASIFGEAAYDKFVFRQLFYVQPRLFFVAEVEKELAGLCFGIYGAGSKLAWILTLGVSQNYRKKGVGRLLMNRIEEEIQSLGAKGVALHVSPDNKEAVSLYKSRGYETRKTILDFGEMGQERLEMVKEIHGS